MAGAQMLTGNQTALLNSQPLYIRTAGPFQGQQGMLGNIQAVTAAQRKGKMDGQGNVQVFQVCALLHLNQSYTCFEQTVLPSLNSHSHDCCYCVPKGSLTSPKTLKSGI